MSAPPGSRGWPVLRRLAVAGCGAGVERAVFGWARSRPGAGRWNRTNHRGDPVTLLAGPAVVAGALASVAVAPRLPPRVRWAALVAGGVAGWLGALDDLAGSAEAKGLGGHLRALADGRVTTGGWKVLGIGASGMAAGALTRPPGRWTPATVRDAVMAGAVVAGGANLANLLDLRPGRATKGILACGLPMVATSGVAGDVVSGPLGAAAASLSDDLAERAMLGDAGANTLGALVGTAAAVSLPPRWLQLTAATIVALTLASERVSFTEVIERTPVLRQVDDLGRRPAP
jgi:UDP-N-acetylmuramyl pentapeptide phosphotransferase/UDP-N-acetylglucosamine-1-phosphate transferase